MAQLGQSLFVIWAPVRRLLSVFRDELIVELPPELLDGTSRITVTAGDRCWQLIVGEMEDSDDGFFGERRTNGRAHQGL
jgi:hypothetical protein